MTIFLNDSQTIAANLSPTESLTALAAGAQFVIRENERFAGRFPPAAANEALMPAFTWNQLERQLLDLAEDKSLSVLVRSALARSAGRADTLPAELLLREILVLAAIIQESHSPAINAGEGDSSMP